MESSSNNNLKISTDYPQGTITLGTGSNVTALSIDKDGDVSIGSTSPLGILYIEDTTPIFTIGDDQDKTWSVGDELSTIDFISADASSSLAGAVRARIVVVQENTPGSAQGIAFYTRNTATLSEKMRIGNAGIITLGGDGTNFTQFAPDGEHTMAGTARVLISIDLEPVLATRPVSNPPAEGTEDSFPTHDFDASTDESVYFHLELPHDYADAGTIHVHFDFFVDTAPASAQSVVWGVEYKKQSIGDNFDFDAGTTTTYTQTSVTTGTPANDKKTHQSAEVNLTTTGFVAGDYILLRLFRDADGTGGTDDYPSDARVLDYHIEYLADKIGEAT